MKSVGEVMAIGRTFKEALHKGLRGLETGVSGFARTDLDDTRIKEKLLHPDPDRIFYVKRALDLGWAHDEIFRMTGIDPWFLDQIQQIVDLEKGISSKMFAKRRGKVLAKDVETLREAKRMGFSDARLAKLTKRSEAEVRSARKAAGIVPVYKRVDTCSAEFESFTPYMYSTYESECEAAPTRPQEGRHPRQRPQPHRAGHRVRLLLLPRLLRVQGGGVRDHHGQLQPGDGLDRLRHLRPAVLRAAHLRGRDEHPRDGEAGGGRRAVRRPDPAAPLGPPARGRRPDPRARAPTPRTSPRTASASRRSSTSSASRSRRAAPPPRSRRRRRSRSASATPCWCGPPTCSAAGPWRSSTTPAAWRSTCARRSRPRPSTRSWWTGSWRTPSRWTWTPSATASAW